MKAEQQYIDLFTHYEDLICRHAAGLMNLPRAEALADLERLGFPTVKSEDYKYTDVNYLIIKCHCACVRVVR